MEKDVQDVAALTLLDDFVVKSPSLKLTHFGPAGKRLVCVPFQI